MRSRNLSKLYFLTLNYRVLHFYFFLFYWKFLSLDLVTYFVKLCCNDTYIFSLSFYAWWLQRIRENLTMIRKVKRDRLDGDRFDPNGACVEMKQRNLQLICWIRGLKGCPIWGDFRGVTGLLMQWERERKISSTPSYLIIWVTPITIKNSLIRIKSRYT